MSRDPQTIQNEIERTRDALAATFDKLADRTKPKHVADRARSSLRDAVRSPAGIAVIGAAAGLAALLVVRRVRRR